LIKAPRFQQIADVFDAAVDEKLGGLRSL